MNVRACGKDTGTLFNVAVYGMLFVLGAVQGVIGSFQYSWMAGPVPVAALACCAVLLATCLLAAWTVRSVSGARARGRLAPRGVGHCRSAGIRGCPGGPVSSWVHGARALRGRRGCRASAGTR